MKTLFTSVTSTSFISYVHSTDGEKRFYKSLRKEEFFLHECSFIEVDEYIEDVLEEDALPPTFEEIIEDFHSNK
jgi:hypothetical protein